jgi:peroxiredoxin/TolB-like protein
MLRWAVVLVAGLVLSAPAQDMGKEISGISEKLSKALVAKGKKKIALIDFVDLQGRSNELGRFLSEQLSVELVNAEGISVVDRAHIKSILDEHKLTEEGLVNPENAKKLGQFAGVDAILTGTVTILDDSFILVVKAISSDTAEVVAAGKITSKQTVEIQQLLKRGVEASGASIPSASGAPVVPALNRIGSLSVGDTFELKFRSTDGRDVDLSALKGKVVLVAFWATWAEPKTHEMQNVKDVYDKFHSKGFEVVGVSLDTDRSALETFTKREDMPWPQSYSGDGWDDSIAKKYAIKSIPALLLIGKDGKIAAANVRGLGTLEKKLDELLK